MQSHHSSASFEIKHKTFPDITNHMSKAEDSAYALLGSC